MAKFVSALALGLALVSSTASADFLGIYAGGGMWNHDPSGSFSSTNAGSSNIDITSDLGFSKKSEVYMWAAFDHPIPLIPNIRIEKTALSQNGSMGGTGVSFNGAAAVAGSSSITLDSMDTILYYRLLDNWVNFDFGFNLRKLDGKFTVGNQTVKISESLPMLYLSAQFDVPFLPISFGADYNVVALGGNKYDDTRLRFIYEMGFFGFEVGTRTTKLVLEDGIDTSFEFSGVMLGAFLHF